MTKEKKITDYLHLYMGCRVNTPDGARKLLGLNGLGNATVETHPKEIAPSTGYFLYHESQVTPILRPLSDMTEEEAKEFFETGASSTILNKRIVKSGVLFEYSWVSDNPERNNADGFSYSEVGMSFAPQLNAAKFRWLLSKGFDLFNLIPDGLAIDSTTLK